MCGRRHACICVNSGFVFLASFCFVISCLWSYLLLVSTNVCTSHCPVSLGRLSVGKTCGHLTQSVRLLVRLSAGLAVRKCTDMSLHNSECALVFWAFVTVVLDGRCCRASLGVVSANGKATGYARTELRQELLACTI